MENPRVNIRTCLLVCASAIAGVLSTGAAHADSQSLTEARAIVERAMVTPTLTLAGPPIEVGDKLRGKKILWLQSFSSLPFWTDKMIGFRAAMEAAGIELTIVDPGADLIKAAREIEGGINRGFDLINLGNETPSELAAPVRAAKEAGIPVDCMLARGPGPLTEEEKSIGCVAVTTADYKAIGELAAAATFLMSNGDETIQAIAFNAPGGSGVADIQTNGFLDKLKALCPTCTVSQVDAPPASWATDLGPLTTSQITANPGLDWLFPIYGGAVQFMVPAIAAAGAEDRVRIGTQENSTTAIRQVQQGDLAYTVSLPNEWFGLAAADVAFRILLGEQVPDDVKVPLRLFTADNVKDIDANAEPVDQAKWFGVDYRTPYFKNWGLQAPEGYIR